jgi:hypothetical protein
MGTVTDPAKTYVIAKGGSNPMFLCISKGKRSKQYWGLYIGTLGKRYGAERFSGGPALDRLLSLNGNYDLSAIEVKK